MNTTPDTQEVVLLTYPTTGKPKFVSYSQIEEHGNRVCREDGTLDVQSPHDDQGRIHGLWRSFHKNGVVSTDVLYEHGEIAGAMQLYNENGEMTATFSREQQLGLAPVSKLNK